MTQPVLLPSGHDIVATDLDAYENLTAAWAAYTPVWTAVTVNPVLGNGTLTGVYMQAGKYVTVRIVLVAGTTTTFGTGFYRFSLPVAPKQHSLLGAFCEDASATARWSGQARITAASATGDNMRIVVAPNTGGISEVSPFTWANGDILVLSGTYEAV